MEAVYPNAFAGSEGWIADTRTDEDGFDWVLVAWDRDHWRYAGEKDIWTFANHFELIDGPQYPPDVEPEEPEAQPEPEPVVEEDDEDEELVPCPGCGIPHVTAKELKWMEYFDSLQDAFERAADSDNFVLITVAPRKGDPDTLAPHVYMQSHTPAHSHMLFSQMANLVAGAYKSVAHREQEKQYGRKAADVHPDDQERPPEQE